MFALPYDSNQHRLLHRRMRLVVASRIVAIDLGFEVPFRLSLN